MTKVHKVSKLPAKTRQGFSVVELLITLGVAGLSVILIGSMYASATRLSDRSTDILVANSKAYEKLQKYENSAFASIPFTTDGTAVEDFSAELPTSLPGVREGKVYVSLYPTSNTSLKYVFVRVKFGYGGGEHVVEYGDFVQSGGLGR